MKQDPRREHRHLVRFSSNVGFNKKYTTIAIYALIVLLFAVVCVYFLLNNDKYTSVFNTVKGIVSPIFIGMIIAYILNPCMEMFENVVFISKARRTLRKARRELLKAKLSYDQELKLLRSGEAPSDARVNTELERLTNARDTLSRAKAAVKAEEDAKALKYRKNDAKKRRRPSFFPQPEKDRSHPMRGLSLLCTYIIFFAVISLILWIVIPQCIQSLTGLLVNLESFIRSLPNRLKEILNSSETLRSLYDFVNDHVDVIAEVYKFVGEASGMLTGLLATLPAYAVNLFSSLASGITNLLLSIFFSIYFLSSKEMLGRQITRLGRAFLTPKAYRKTRHVVGEIDRKFGKFIEGKILDSTIIGLLALAATAIMGMPYYQMLALIIGITNVIPFFGPIIGGIIGGAIVLISEPAKLIPFLIMVLILQQLDGNVIGPQILGDSLGLAPIWIMIAIVVMSGLFDFFGMLFGVPLFAVIYTLVQEAIDERLKKRKQKLAAALAAEAEAEAAEEVSTPSDTPSAEG